MFLYMLLQLEVFIYVYSLMRKSVSVMSRLNV